MVNILTKNLVLHTILPTEFQVADQDCYPYQMQQKIFDKHCILIRADFPMKDSKGKKMDLDPYGRDIGSVTILKDKAEINLGDLLRKVGLADFYEGETKKRTFMTKQGFEKVYQGLQAINTSPEILSKLDTLFKALGE